jgi:hypothetical protein
MILNAILWISKSMELLRKSKMYRYYLFIYLLRQFEEVMNLFYIPVIYFQ